MPPPADILRGLGAIARQHIGLAIAWHIVIGGLVGALLAGWRPRKRLAGTLLALPLASVSTLAWIHGNPFNGTTFAIFTVALAALALRLPSEPVAFGPLWGRVAGAVLLGFGWAYPHFLEGSALAYLYAAPLGLVPCPTLSAVIGLGLLLGGLGAWGWSWSLAVAGLLYGLFGALRLGVTIDVVLVAGAVLVGLAGLRASSARASTR